MHTSDTSPAPLTTTARRVGFSLVAMGLLLSGCMERYRDIGLSLDVDYNEREFVSLITNETGYRTRASFADRFAHGAPAREYADQHYELLVARWSAHDGRLIDIEPFAPQTSPQGRLWVGSDDLIILDHQVFQRNQGLWRQVNAGREYATWSGTPGIRECFTPDYRRHLFGDGRQLQIRDTATGDISWSRAVDVAWLSFAGQASEHHLTKWTLDSAGRRVLCVVYDDAKHQARILVFDLQDGSFRKVLIDSTLMVNEPRADLTVIRAVDVVDGKVQFLIEASEPISIGPGSKIRLRLITEDRRILYDNAWRHEYQTDIRWRPGESLLLMSDTGEGSLDSKQTRITRIDYGKGQETTFPIAFPSEAEVLRHCQTR